MANSDGLTSSVGDRALQLARQLKLVTLNIIFSVDVGKRSVIG